MVERFVFGDKFLGTGYQNCKGEKVQWNEAASGWNCSEGMDLRLPGDWLDINTLRNTNVRFCCFDGQTIYVRFKLQLKEVI